MPILSDDQLPLVTRQAGGFDAREKQQEIKMADNVDIHLPPRGWGKVNLTQARRVKLPPPLPLWVWRPIRVAYNWLFGCLTITVTIEKGP